MHHIITDGWSFGVFKRELGALYEAFSKGSRRRCRICRCSMRIMRPGSGSGCRGRCLEGQVAYWKEQLGGSFRSCSCPRTVRGRRCRRHRGARQSFDLPEGLAEKIKAI